MPYILAHSASSGKRARIGAMFFKAWWRASAFLHGLPSWIIIGSFRVFYSPKPMRLDMPNVPAVPIEAALTALGQLLAAEGEEVAIVVLGGAALSLLGILERPTRDVDVLALADRTETNTEPVLRPPDPLPAALEKAAAAVARDLRLPGDWLNTVAALQWRGGLPPGLGARLHWRRYDGLWVGLVDRYDLIFFKLYAAADAGPESVHYRDLLALEATGSELEAAAAWVRGQDASAVFPGIVDQVVENVIRARGG